MDKSDALGTERLSKLIPRFAIPSIIGMMITALYNVVDRIYVGNIPGVGSTAFAGISLTFPLTLLVIACAGLFKLGSNSLAAISLGEGRRDRANKAVNQCFIMCGIVGIIFTIIVLAFTDPILNLLGASAATLPHARSYLKVIALGSVFNFIGFGMNDFLYTDGSPKMAMGSMLLGGALNIILDPIFIYGMNQGAMGAATATVIAQVASFIWTMGYFYTKHSSFKIRIKEMIPDLWLLRKICTLGMPVFINQIAHSIFIAVLNTQSARYGGDMAITSIGIVLALTQFTNLPVIGMSHGLQPIWGYNYGSGNMKRVLKSYYIGVIAGVAYITALYAGFMIFPHVFTNLFVGSSPVDVEFTNRAIRIFLLLEPLVGFEIITANFYPSIKMPAKSLILNVFKQMVALIPLLFILPIFMGMEGILIAGPIGEALTVLVSVIVVYRDLGKIHRGEFVKVD